MNAVIAFQRLANQRLTRTGPRRPEDVVVWQGAVQAQEYAAARWGVGQRMAAGATDAAIKRAVDSGRILRTHVLRPTWHFVTPADIRWMLELTASRVHRILSRYHRRLEVDARLLTRATSIFERALGDGPHLTRGDLGVRLARAGLAATGIRLAMLTMHAELEGVICSGGYRGNQLTYALLDERAPQSKPLPREEALAELTRRFFTSHAPATERDFAWWSGLTVADARRGLDINRARSRAIDGMTYWSIGRASSRPARPGHVLLLPVYDEYLVAYRDRDAVPLGVAMNALGRRGPMTFQNPLVIDGQAAGTWKPVRQSRDVAVEVRARPLNAAERRAVAAAAARYGRFIGSPVTLRLR